MSFAPPSPTKITTLKPEIEKNVEDDDTKTPENIEPVEDENVPENIE